MNQHTAITRKTPKTRKKAAPAKLQTIALTARKAADTVSRAGARAAEPIVASLKHEKPETLAKMALAALAPALAPKLAVAAIRFAMRNPLILAAGVLAFAAVAIMSDDGETATT